MTTQKNLPWHEMSAIALGNAIGRGEVDPVTLTEHFLARIERIDTKNEI